MVKSGESAKRFRPSLRIRARRIAGFVLGVAFLALIDLWYHYLPRLTGGFRRKR